MGLDKLKGTWKADLDRYGDVNPEMGALGPQMMDMMLGKLEVEITDDKLVMKGYGGKDTVQEGSFTATEKGDTVVLEATLGSSGRKGVFEAKLVDDDHLNLTLVEPQKDPMALKRA